MAALLRGDRKPTKGNITLNGIEVSEFGDQISKYLGVISQKPYLFNTTIANNLRLGNEKATDKQLCDVLERVGLKRRLKHYRKN